MKCFYSLRNRLLLVIFLTGMLPALSCAQGILSRTVSIDVNRQRLDNVLEILSNKGDFYFSYNSNIIKKDSLVTLSAQNKTIKQLLDVLFNGKFEYVESGNYIIIRRAPIRISLITNQVYTEDKIYVVSGYVLDEESGETIRDASIYEKRRLLSTLTDAKGYFEMRLKTKPKTAALTVSKEFYEDTTIVIKPNYNQQLNIAIVPVSLNSSMVTVSPNDFLVPDSIVITVQVDSVITKYTHLKNDSIKVERTAVGRFLLSSKQKVQAINLEKFFAERAFQLSVTPGLSTHGKLSGQVINNFSFNVFGGYSGGLKGLEIGGLFNIDKKYVRYAQVAGLFNIVGGPMTGLQVAGLHNTVLDTVKGLQVAGINNLVKGNFTGLQVGGIYNHVTDSVKGLQVGGIANFAGQKVHGSQIAGIANFSNKEVTGVQAAGIINYTKHLKGVQIGLLNIADTSEGYGIGFINIVLKGYHKLSFSTNEVLNTNIAFKTGTKKLYNILQVGLQISPDEKIFSYGYGIGTSFSFGKGWSLNPELTSHYLYLGSLYHLNLLNKLHLNLNLQLGKYVSLFAGPSFAVYYSNQTIKVTGYKLQVPPDGYHSFNMGHNVNGWFGWNAGISFF